MSESAHSPKHTASMPPPLAVKLGGSALEELDQPWWDDLAALGREVPLVLVHGWSKALRRHRPEYAEAAAVLRDRYGNQSRWTTPEVIADIKSVSEQAGQLILGELTRRGLSARRLLGSDGLLAAGEAERWWWRGKELVELDNLVGPVTGADAGLVKGLRPGTALLVTPLARDPAGREVNTDADRAAAALAAALRATALVLVTDVPRLLVDGAPVARIGAAEAAAFRDRGATGGMRKKLRAAGEALDGSVARVVLGSGLVSDLLAERAGTVIRADWNEEP